MRLVMLASVSLAVYNHLSFVPECGRVFFVCFDMVAYSFHLAPVCCVFVLNCFHLLTFVFVFLSAGYFAFVLLSVAVVCLLLFSSVCSCLLPRALALVCMFCC